METFPLNNLAEKFEVGRSTMVRAMRGVPPDEVARGNRPKWKVATVAKALEAQSLFLFLVFLLACFLDQ